MEFSKLKLELYDLAAIVLPGIFLIAEIWATLLGIGSLASAAKEVTGAQLTVLLLCGFGAGNVIQEGGNRLVTLFLGKRYFKLARDRFWNSPDAELVRAKIKADDALEVSNVDVAFDYCLSHISDLFMKRDVFLAISDFARSLWLLSAIGIFPLGRAVLYADGTPTRMRIGLAGGFLLAVTGWLGWVRMVRFRELSETPVFTTFLACKSAVKSKSCPDEEKAD